MSWFVWLFTKLFCDVGWFCHFYHPLLPRFTFDIFMVQQKKMGNYQNQEMKLPQFQNIRWRDIPFHGFQMVNRTVGTVDSCISICLTSLVFTGQPDMFFRWPVRRFRKRESRHSFSVENGKKPLRSTRMNSVSTLAFFKPSLYEFVLRFFFSNPWKILEDPWICGKLKWSHFPTQCTNLAGRCFSRCGLNAFHGGAGGTRRGHPLSWQVLPSKLMCTWWCLMM